MRQPQPTAAPHHFFGICRGPGWRSVGHVAVATFLFLGVLLLLAPLPHLGGVNAPGWAIELWTYFSFGLAILAVAKFGRWAFPSPVSSLLELSDGRVCLRVPTGKRGSAYRDHAFENRGLTLVRTRGEEAWVRLPDGETLRMPRRYLPRANLARTVYRGTPAMATAAGEAWVLSVRDGALALERSTP